MHQEKHALLAKVPGLATAVVAAAARMKVSTDDVVHAAHGRPVSQDARAAFASLDPDQRRALQGIEWPFNCPACHEIVDVLITCTNTDCGSKGCENCRAPGACPTCRAKAKQAEEERKRQAEEKRRLEEARRQGEEERGAAAAKAET